ncbi:PQQ-binding-like beta-propeller repeat protein [Desulfobacterales bacterium HSG2]|nr:PQQ-binding-like beta-propeller repeat protein [Desulfobacterales bacterium HSG2]
MYKKESKCSIVVFILLCFGMANPGLANAAAGAKLWEYPKEYPMGGSVVSSPAVLGGKVCFGSNDNTFYCLDIETGEELWQPYLTGGSIISCPAIREGRIFFGSHDSKLYCLDEQTGEKLWDYDTGSLISSSPAISNGKIFFGILQGKYTFYCLDAQTGEKVWEYEAGNSIPSSPTVKDGKVFFGSEDKKLYCLNAEDGEEVWPPFETGGTVGLSPAISGDKVFFGSADGKFYCLNTETGDKVWEYPTGGQIWSSPAISGGRVFFGSADNKFYCLNAEDGEWLWECETSGPIYSSPAVSNSMIFFGNTDKNLYCLNAETGDELWKYPTGGAINSSPAISNGKIFFGSDDHKLYCLDAGDPNMGGWPMFSQDLQHTGDTAHYKSELLYGIIQINPINEFSQYELRLLEVYEDNDFMNREIPFSVSDPDIATVTGNTLTASRNGRLTISADYDGTHYEYPRFVMTSHDHTEGVDNDTKEKAELPQPNEFWKGDMLTVTDTNDVDYYKLTIDQDSVMPGLGYVVTDIGYLAEGDTAETSLELSDASGNVLISGSSADGEDIILSRGLSVGEYYLKLTPGGDPDQDSSYYVCYAPVTDLQYETEPNETYQPGTAINPEKPVNAMISDSDIDFHTFSLNAPRYIKIDFATPGSDTDYHLTLYREDDQTPIDDTLCLKGSSSAFIEVGLTGGTYYLKVELGQNIGIQPFYTLTIRESDNTHLEIESNNTLRFANPLDNSQSRQGKIYSESDVDYYGFSVEGKPDAEKTDVQITFDSDSETADYKISLTNGEGTQISLTNGEETLLYSKTSDNGAATELERSLSPGNYYVRIEPGGDIDPASFYHLSIETTVIPYVYLDNVSVSAQTDEMGTEGTLQLNATGIYSDATQEPISNPDWSSSDEAIAQVNENGLVTGISDGYVIVYASYEGKAGQISLKVGTGYIPPDQEHGNLILVAGGGDDTEDVLYESTQYLSDKVYSQFVGRGFKSEDIYYFNPVSSHHDIDGDGYPDPIVSDDTPTVDEVLQSVETWAANQRSTGPLYLVMINHGGIRTFEVLPYEIITAEQLKGSLSIFQENTRREVIILMEACKSGSFSEYLTEAGTEITDDLTEPVSDLMVITCTDDKNAYLGRNGRISFTQFFMDKLYGGNTFCESFNSAREQLAACGTPYNRMIPQLAPEGTPLSENYLVGDFAIAPSYPQIQEQTESLTIKADTAVELTVTIPAHSGQTDVWAVMEPPDYRPPDLVEDLKAPEVTIPTVDLADEDAENVLDGRFTGTYENFVCNGEYRIVFYARNTDGLVTVSDPTLITVTGGTNLDFDSSGAVDIGDAVLGLRIVAGFESDHICSGDINGDGKVGLVEVVHILGFLSAIR